MLRRNVELERKILTQPAATIRNRRQSTPASLVSQTGIIKQHSDQQAPPAKLTARRKTFHDERPSITEYLQQLQQNRCVQQIQNVNPQAQSTFISRGRLPSNPNTKITEPSKMAISDKPSTSTALPESYGFSSAEQPSFDCM